MSAEKCLKALLNGCFAAEANGRSQASGIADGVASMVEQDLLSPDQLAKVSELEREWIDRSERNDKMLMKGVEAVVST